MTEVFHQEGVAVLLLAKAEKSMRCALTTGRVALCAKEGNMDSMATDGYYYCWVDC